MCCCVICGYRNRHRVTNRHRVKMNLRCTTRCVSLRRTSHRRVSCRMTNHLREEHSSNRC